MTTTTTRPAGLRLPGLHEHPGLAGRHGSTRRPPRPMRGFTLVEMMIVAAIVAILAAIAYPSYQAQLRKGQRAEAKAALMQAAQRLERVMSQNGAFPAAAGDLALLYGQAAGALITSDPDNPTSLRGRFQLVYAPGAGASPVEYTLTAQPRTPAISDSECPSFGLDSRGRRLVNGAVVTATSLCWK